MATKLVNSKDPDEISHNLHFIKVYSVKVKNTFSETKINHNFEMPTLDPLKHKMDYF